jgi:uncharacterized protein
MASSIETLRGFLEDPNRPTGTFGVHELQGFLFAVVNAPEVIMPSEWIPEVFNGSEIEFETMDEARSINLALMDVYNSVNEASLGDSLLPPGCIVGVDAMADFDEQAPLSQWSRGFLAGHQWLERMWESYQSVARGLAAEEDEDDDESEEPELDEALGTIVLMLSFFSSRRLAEAFATDTGSELATIAIVMHEGIPEAVREYVALGRNIQDIVAREWQPQPAKRTSPKIGRNDPCPCGSGRKYKRCCGAQ